MVGAVGTAAQPAVQLAEGEVPQHPVGLPGWMTVGLQVEMKTIVKPVQNQDVASQVEMNKTTRDERHDLYDCQPPVNEILTHLSRPRTGLIVFKYFNIKYTKPSKQIPAACENSLFPPYCSSQSDSSQNWVGRTTSLGPGEDTHDNKM